MREWEIGAVENIHGALPYIRFAPILALVGVGVNRIGKVEINTRLDLNIQSFKLTQRRVLIDRLVNDPGIMAAVAARSAAENIPRQVLLADVARHAREIVPAFISYVNLFHRAGHTHDGTVELANTRLEGARDSIVIDAHHTFICDHP